MHTVPQVPWSHPFIERLIATLRREYLDRLFFWTAEDLERKLESFKHYYNAARVRIKVYPATRQMRKPALQQPRPPALRITSGKTIAVGCLNFQSLLE